MKKVILTTILLTVVLNTYANEFRLSIENDLFYKTDGYYTHGTTLSYTYPVVPTNHWLLHKPVSFKRVVLGQYIYTPNDIKIPELIEDDRPYGGLLYLDQTSYMKTRNRMQSFSIISGIVGPHAYAEETQKWVHERTGSATPQGWDNQIDDEPTLNVQYIDKYRLRYNWYSDTLWYYGGIVGNLNTHACIGGTVKFGLNVPDNYNIVSLEPIPTALDQSSLYIFLGVEGRAIVHNIFLDGNTFSDSHSVDKEYFVGDLIGGISLIVDCLEITYSVHLRSKEFEQQKRDIEYGGISIAYRW